MSIVTTPGTIPGITRFQQVVFVEYAGVAVAVGFRAMGFRPMLISGSHSSILWGYILVVFE